MSVAQLKAQLDNLGVSYASNAKKAELQALLEQNSSNAAAPASKKKAAAVADAPASGASAAKKAKGGALADVFDGVPDEWRVLEDVLLAQPRVHDFLGAARAESIVPVREMTLQALKANPPSGWRLIIFGQQPYPRVESATGVAMFDNSFHEWVDARFGKVVSMRCLIKAAAMHQFGVAKSATTDDLRKLLRKHNIVTPPEWFSSLLSQGVLLLNAALTVSTDDAITLTQHTNFWLPVLERVVQCVLESRRGAKQGLVFAWWGTKADKLRRLVEAICARYPSVAVRHCVHANPAAQGDAFCNGTVFKDLNDALVAVQQPPVQWLPSRGGDGALKSDPKMAKFISDTSAMHRLFMERLGGVRYELQESLDAISLHGVKLVSFENALLSLHDVVEGLDSICEEAAAFADAEDTAGLSRDQTAAIHAYTQAGPFFRTLNSALRNADRSQCVPFHAYLKLFDSALEALQLQRHAAKPVPTLFRGVAADLKCKYAVNSDIVWWGVSSCTEDYSVAEAFVGFDGARCIFKVRARRACCVAALSAVPDEAEWLLAPGTWLRVRKVTTDKTKLTTIELEELVDKKRSVQ